MRHLVNSLWILGTFAVFPGLAQDLLITGEVTDGATGDPVPFANLIIKGTDRGTVTDFDGHYELLVPPGDHFLVASYIGYVTKAKPINTGLKQSINFQLEEELKNLKEIVFRAGENPAFPIMRQVVKNKRKNDKKSLDAYEFESYNKIEFDIDNLTSKFKSRGMVQKVQAVIDSVDRIAGEDGNPVLPIFFSESISKFYFRNNPKLQKEHILKTKITGVGIQDGTLVSQLIGSSFQEYNFYQNWLNILDKEFASPIADGWRYYYDVFLIDSLFIDDYFCYRIDVYPKRDQDLAFNGTIWVTQQHSALKRVDLFIDKKANLNFIEKIKIQQELEKTEAGPWIPIKSRVLVDMAEVNPNYAGLLAKFYTSNKDWVINEPYKPRFYNTTIVMDEQATELNDSFWETNRHDPLTQTERNVYKMIDTLRTIPVVKTTTDLVTYFASGYVEWGITDLGPWPLTYAFNDINESPALTTGAEGHRFRLGMRTNEHLSKKVELNGYLAYGTRDRKLKYQAGIGFILDRGPWTRLDFKYGKDIQQVGLNTNERFQGSIAFETVCKKS